MTAVQLAPLATSPLPDRADWRGVLDAIELFILERRADKKQPATIRYYRQQLGLYATPKRRPIRHVSEARTRGR